MAEQKKQNLSDPMVRKRFVTYKEATELKAKVEELAYKLANQLVKEDFRVTSGFGLGIGSSVINGVLDEIYSSRYKHTSEHLCLRPFPQGIVDVEERKAKGNKV